jgi:hypothetical protein
LKEIIDTTENRSEINEKVRNWIVIFKQI